MLVKVGVCLYVYPGPRVLIRLGGWDRETFEIPKDLDKQIAQAFENCEFALKDAGGKGFEQVSDGLTAST